MRRNLNLDLFDSRDEILPEKFSNHRVFSSYSQRIKHDRGGTFMEPRKRVVNRFFNKRSKFNV